VRLPRPLLAELQFPEEEASRPLGGRTSLELGHADLDAAAEQDACEPAEEGDNRGASSAEPSALGGALLLGPGPARRLPSSHGDRRRGGAARGRAGGRRAAHRRGPGGRPLGPRQAPPRRDACAPRSGPRPLLLASPARAGSARPCLLLDRPWRGPHPALVSIRGRPGCSASGPGPSPRLGSGNHA
jgi:hypothetical protein